MTRPTPMQIIEAAAQEWHVEVDQVIDKHGSRSVQDARMAAVYLAMKRYHHSTSLVSLALGKRDSTAIWAAYHLAEGTMHSDFSFRRSIERIERKLKGPTQQPKNADAPAFVDERVFRMRRLRKDGWTKKRLAEHYGVPNYVVDQIVGERDATI